MKQFSHLHTHSHYSLLNALPKIPELIKRAKKEKMPAVALTDNCNLYGAVEFYKECEKAEIKPILGIDAYIALRGRKDKQAGIDNIRYRLVLLAKNEKGYKNLIELVTLAHLEGFYYKPRIDKEILEQYKEGLICIMPSFSGELVKTLSGAEPSKAKECSDWYKNIFGEDFFIEITKHEEIDGHNERIKLLVDFAKNEHIPIVAAHDVYYLDPEDKKARDTLISIQNQGERDRGSFENEEDFSFITKAKANELFKEIPEALDNVQTIIDRIDLKLSFGSWVFPDLKVESGRSYDDELRHVVYEGLTSREVELTQVVKDRIEYELGIIAKKGYSPYFLVVQDLLKYAHENGILTNIRGSVAGSMVTYLSHITNVNPLDYKLPFERFLNPERPSAPDIDMDFADNRRDEIIDYARRKYGSDKVAQIGTFGTMMARGAVRDVARALGFPYATGDKISKLIPLGAQGFPMTIDRAMKLVPELKTMYETEKDVQEIIDMAKKIEGCARHISVHAAGVVISPTKLTDFVPLQFDTKGEDKIITQYDMHAVEDAGLLKFDFLGLKNLAIISDTIHRIEAIEGHTIDIEQIPLDDPKTFALLSKGDTEGLFQLNGDGMTKFLIDLKPSSIHDINAMVALYRPGPMESIPQYIERKQDPSKLTYLDPRMKDILDQSYGVITYQDDVMLIAIHLAGYSWLEADKLRKAMGKKIPEVMQAEKGKLIEGLIKNGMTKAKADNLWLLIEPFAAYGFNKAHAASYGRVAYQTAYLKANYPAIYMSAVLTADSGNVDKIGEFITECKRMEIPVLPPNVNESFQGFSVVREHGVPDKIRFGLTTIKNFGEGIADSIIAERKKNGRFVSLADFVDRVKDRNLNRKSLESLIKTGGLDEFGERGIMLSNIDLLLEYHREHMKGPSNQDSLFGLMADNSTVPTLTLVGDSTATMEETLGWEKELLGLYISGHPLEKFREKLSSTGVSIARIMENPREGASVAVGGLVEEIREVITKGNEPMIFMRLADLTGTIETVVFPKTYAQYKEILKPESVIAVFAKISKRNGEVSLIIEKVKVL